MDSLREELSTILAEKDRTEGLMEKLKVDLDTVEQGYLNLKAGTLRQNDRLAEIMGIAEAANSPHATTDITIERAVRSLVHDNRLKFEDCLSLKEELSFSEKQR
jgi:hypothetical protein